ncbi:MAG: M17 family peptidase N-terminal domain-containing protein [Myxococcota bacterium]
MSLLLRVEVLAAPLERARADVLLAGFFASERPLRGGAGRADWRLCGLVSRLVQEGRIRGEEGEAALLPGGPVFMSPRLLLVGCGDSAAFDRTAQRRIATGALARTAALGVESVALALPLGGTNRLSLDSSTLALVEGAIGAGTPLPVLRLLVPEGTERGIAGVVERFGRGHRGVDFEVILGSPAEPRAAGGPSASTASDANALSRAP